MNTGIIFDIKRYAIHDGPGIRTTVFFKGCPLHCSWCHNPEGIRSAPEFVYRQEKCAEACDLCVNSCPPGAISKSEAAVTIDETKCDLCRDCVDACVHEALEIAGRELTIQDLLGEVERDSMFYRKSGGGVTLSGGEPVAQHDFVCGFLDALKGRGLHTALDTSGHIPFEELEIVSEYVDLFLYDIKLMDPDKHEMHTGVSNDIILDNLRRLNSLSKPVAIRFPIIPGVNDDDQNISATIDFLRTLNNVSFVNVLPYHKGGIQKMKRLSGDNECRVFGAPAPEDLRSTTEALLETGLTVITGG